MLDKILHRPELKIALGSILISFCPLFVKLSSAGPTIDGFYRMLFGGIGLVLITLIRRQAFIKSRQALMLAILAGLFFGADLSFWHQSIEVIGPGLATIIVNLQIIPLALLGFFVFKDKLDGRFLASVPVALFGMYLLIGHNWGGFAPGFKFAIFQSVAAMISYSLYTMTLRQTQTIATKTDPMANLAIICLVAAIVLGVVAYWQQETFMPPATKDWLWFSLNGIFGQILGWLLISMGLPFAPISRAGLLLLLQPACALSWDMLFLGRPTSALEILGTLITLAAIYSSAIATRIERRD